MEQSIPIVFVPSSKSTRPTNVCGSDWTSSSASCSVDSALSGNTMVWDPYSRTFVVLLIIPLPRYEILDSCRLIFIPLLVQGSALV
jgi:hypothetical protein